MELETKAVSTLGTEMNQPSQYINKNRRELVQEILSQQAKPAARAKKRESKMDIISVAVVIGMTAQFVSFLFGLVTEFVPRILDITVISLFLGLIVTVIAYAIMKEGS